MAEKTSFAADPASQFLGYRGVGSEASMLTEQVEHCEQYKIGYYRQSNGNTRDAARERLVGAPFAAGATWNYWRSAQVVAGEIVATVAEILDLGRDYFSSRSSQPLHQLGLNYYPQAAVDTGISMSAHVDLCLLTLISQNGPGLQVQSSTGDYQTVGPRPGTILCILGEYLHRWSGGRFRAPMHRVLTSGRSDRLSIIYKHRPDYDSVIDVPFYCAQTGKIIQQHFVTGPAYEQKINRIMGHEPPQTTRL